MLAGISTSARSDACVGLDQRVHVDYQQGELQVGDIFLLTSDGVHDRVHSEPTSPRSSPPSGAVGERGDDVMPRTGRGWPRQRNRARDPRERLARAARGRDPAGRRVAIAGEAQLGDSRAPASSDGAHRRQRRSPPISGRARRSQLVAIKTLHEARASDQKKCAMLRTRCAGCVSRAHGERSCE